MLTELLQHIEHAQRPCLVSDLCHVLHAQPSAVEGMIELLVRRGRILEIGPDDRPCAQCALQGKCDLPVQYGRRFVALPRGCRTHVMDRSPAPCA